MVQSYSTPLRISDSHLTARTPKEAVAAKGGHFQEVGELRLLCQPTDVSTLKIRMVSLRR
jgi:hypothetical protein